jgi:hypothetical protein
MAVLGAVLSPSRNETYLRGRREDGSSDHQMELPKHFWFNVVGIW